MPMSNAALTFEKVTFSYTRAPFIEGLSLEVPRGVVTGVVGPNGCGKSTLMKLGVNLLHPQSGQVFVGDTNLASMSSKMRARAMALLPQSPASTSMDVQTLVSTGRFAYQKPFASLTDADHAAVHRALEVVELDMLRNQTVNQLSGGQRQRAYLAMVLAQEPELLLLDEPTSALDIRASHDILKLARGIVREQGRSICMVIHDLDLALRYCDHLVVMNGGAVVREGTPAQVAESGVLEQVFELSIHRHDTNRGPVWSFFPN